ncbi:MAG: indolepyruvate oxidoreductase subunit beta [Clostridia bacterium]|jgi:indolepyruvate ferredoxin oxidoreductase, beta subunit|nr:indolepyruvate oxidoreductase subunit beta [Clostridia bacterium]
MTNQNSKDILIVGVGGQGTLLASRILGNLAISQGHDVKLSEVHGMAQRGGSVVTHVRYGSKVFAPTVDAGSADIIIAFEKLEALRWIGKLKPNGKMFVNTQEIAPMPVVTGAVAYPSDIEGTIANEVPGTVFVDALSMAKQAGNAKAVNTVLIGVLAKHMDIDKQAFLDAIKATVPERFLDINIIAFEKGYNS